MSWAVLLAVVLLGWIAIALTIGAIVGHGIAFGTGSDFESPDAAKPEEA